MRPILLDLYCKAGGAAMGYYRAGFDVIGVDIAPQPRYPFAFERGDALEFLARYGSQFDGIHASPPCQFHSRMTALHGAAVVNSHPDLIGPTRAALMATGRPWIIENVVGAPLRSPLMLCGAMFGLRTYRHRLFESSELLYAPPHPAHLAPTAPIFGRELRRAGGILSLWNRGHAITVGGHAFPVALGREAMGIPWMTGRELSQAIPPAFTQWLGAQLLMSVDARPVAA